VSTKEIVLTGLKAWESNDAEKMSSLVADDFVLTGPVPQPLGKNEFVGLMHATLIGMPDWAFNITDVQEDGEKVTLKSHITGTHTGTLQLPGLPPIPATGKKIALPEESHTYIIRDGKLHSLTVDSRPDGGIPGMLAQIGFAIPHA
jgi:predicted ester cyclase